MTHINQNAKRIIIQVLCIILACAVVAGGIFGVVKLVEHFNSETKTLNLKFTQGALDSKGEYVETKGSLYTKEAFECQGLSISPAFDNNISYEVFFYDSTGEFLYSSGKQLKNYTFTSSETDIQSMLVSHARIVITPDDDDEIKWNEKSGYVKQLKVEVKRAQTSSLVKLVVLNYEDNNKVFADFELKVDEDKSAKEQYKTSTPVNLSGYTKILVFDEKPFAIYFGDKDSKNIGDQYKIYMKAEVYEIDIPVGAEYVRFAAPFAPSDNQIENAIIYLVK